MIGHMRRLHPGPPIAITIDEACAFDRRRHHDGRPWVEICMVASVDGSTVVNGRSGELSGATDQKLLAGLRRVADVVLVGAGTVRAERYGAPSRHGLRIGVVTRTGDVDLDSALFTSGAGFLVMPEDGPMVAAETVRAGTGSVDLEAALRRLPGDPAVVHVEGGPSLNGALLAGALVDELNATTSPVLTGGDGARMAATSDPVTTPLTLQQLAVDDDGFVFARWLRAASAR